MSPDLEATIFFCISTASAACIVGCLFGIYTMRQDFRRDAIKRGLAQYNPQTGAWEWKADLTRGSGNHDGL
jgi:hypothetical protein